MSSLSITLTRNDISPALTRLIRTARRPAPVLRAMGTVFKSITEGNFNSAGASYRPIPWKDKMDGSPSNLQASRQLSRSFHMSVGDKTVTVSNPMIYAAIHQFGGVIRPKKAKFLSFIGPDGTRYFAKKVTIPPRPFFPVWQGKLTVAAEKMIAAAGQRAVLAQG